MRIDSNFIKTRVSVSLSRYPRLFAFGKSLYLLKRQYEQQLYYALLNKPAITLRDSGEDVIQLQKVKSRFKEHKTPDEVFRVNEPFSIGNLRDIQIDICVPVYNHFDLVKPLLENIKTQVRQLEDDYACRFRIIVADDHSTSRTSTALVSLCEKLGFEYLYEEVNLGVVGNVNAAFSLLSGDFFLLFNSDAEISKNTLLDDQAILA